MSLSHCEKCWDTPCLCGHNYKHLSSATLEEIRKALLKIITDRWDKGRPTNVH